MSVPRFSGRRRAPIGRSPPIGLNEQMTPTLRGVGIGAGYFAPFHYEAWTRIPDVEMVAICDRVEDRARALMASSGINRWYGDWKRMLDEERPDFVDVITPPDTHEEICTFAAERGIQIICQKPLAPTYESSKRIVDLCATAGVRFMVHENFRWQPWYRAIKTLQERGDIGEFTHVHFLMRMGDGWGPDAYLSRQPFFRDYPRLLIYETGVHFIDTCRFLLGDVAAVTAHVKRLNPVIRGEDAAQLLMTFRNGATAIWDANRYNESEAESPRFTFGELRIDGTKGHLTMDTSSTIRVKRLGEPAFELPYVRDAKNFAGDCVFFLQRHFVDCLLSGREFESNGLDYLNNVRVVEAAYESARTGISISLA
jgi:predicted dehydrogenase